MLSKAKIKNHFLYQSWLYVLVAVLSVFIWDLIYTATEYRSPEDKRIEIYVVDSPMLNEEAMQSYLLNVQSMEFPDMEVLEVVRLISGGEQDYMTDIQLNTYIMAGQGDVYIIGKERFKNYATLGTFLPLDEYVEKQALQLDNRNVERGIVAYPGENDKQVVGLVGIPLKGSTMLQQFGVDVDNSFIAVLYRNGNDENSVRMLNYLINLQ